MYNDQFLEREKLREHFCKGCEACKIEKLREREKEREILNWFINRVLFIIMVEVQRQEQEVAIFG